MPNKIQKLLEREVVRLASALEFIREETWSNGQLTDRAERVLCEATAHEFVSQVCLHCEAKE